MMKLIDTFPAFLAYWQSCRQEPLPAQITAYASRYLAPWPELFAMQVAEYQEEQEDWQAIANSRIFPYLEARLPAMQAAHRNLLAICPTIFEQARDTLKFDQEVTVVIYVGLGLGAGWAAPYLGKPAVLFGLENIAEEGWEDEDTLAGLAAHEIGHLVHAAWRQAAGLPNGSGPWWQLCSEGFAQHCERLIRAGQADVQGAHEGEAWWWDCWQDRAALARLFAQAADRGEDIRPFFGSWLEVLGHPQAGYFLGDLCLAALLKQRSLAEIARLEDYRTALRLELLKLGELPDDASLGLSL